MEEEEWEVCNDDGFIYKRKRRPLPPPSSPPLHSLEEERHGRRRRSIVLSRIRDRYRLEIALWEHLSDACRAMRESAEKEKLRASSFEVTVSRGESSAGGRTDLGGLVDKLLFRAERGEDIIRDLTHMCDVAEALCEAQEEQFKQSLLELPVWASPRELMAALCDQ